MEINQELRAQFFEIIDNQINENEPPETKITYDRLKKQGFNDFETKQLIGQCIAVEVFNVMKKGISFNKENYIKNLHNLPNEPSEFNK